MMAEMISREPSSHIVSEVLLTADLAVHQIPHISWRTGFNHRRFNKCVIHRSREESLCIRLRHQS
jgi:hypothetical protein